MIREAIAKGETVEIAFANACRELGVETTEAEFEILELPQKKTFGLFGGAPARVRAYIEEPDPVPEKEERDPAQEAAAYLKSVLSEMGLPEATVEVHPVEAGAELVLGGDDIGFIIGHRGETLDALQYLASLVANHVDGSYFRITLDIGNYRQKRRETLEVLGKKMAAKVMRSRRNCSLEPMNPYERRIIHAVITDIEGVTSKSTGEEPNRKVIIKPTREAPERRPRREGGRFRRDRGRRDNRERAESYERPERAPEEKEAPKEHREAVKLDDSVKLYGKIEL